MILTKFIDILMTAIMSQHRRSLTKSLAFLTIVSFSIYNIIGSTKHISYTTASDHNNYYSDHHINTIKDNQNDTIRISFTLHNPADVPFTDAFSGNHGCKLGPLPNNDGIRTDEIPSSLLLGYKGHHGRVLDFTTTINNNLKILHIGDSVSIQISAAVDEMMGGHILHSRSNIWEAFKGGEGGTLVAPTWGGGMNGGWRITGLLSKAAQGLPATKNRPGGGWNYGQVNPFIHHKYTYQGQNITVNKKMNVVVFRVMHGWMKVEEITKERIIEAAELAHNILGAETIIFLTIPFTNNVLDANMYAEICKVNRMIWDVAKNWHIDHTTTILILDYAQYTNHVIWTNGIHLGYNLSNPLTVKDPQVFDNEGVFMLERLNQNTWPPSIPMVCNKMPTSESGGEYCERNILFKDGMHFCTETMASRIGAALACLLGCVYNKRGSSSATSMQEEGEDETRTESERKVLKIRACERQCNDQYMSVRPIKESWVNSTLASFPDF